MNHPTHPEPIDWDAVQRQTGELLRFLVAIDHQRNQVRNLEEEVQKLMNGLVEANSRLTAQQALIQNLERGLHQARAQSEEEYGALHERLTEVLERDYRNDNPSAATAVDFSRDEALEQADALISSLWGIIAQQLSGRRNREDPAGNALVLAEAVGVLFGGSDIPDERLVPIIGAQHGAEIARKAREIRDRLAKCAPTHSWDFRFARDEALRPGQEPWRRCPPDGLAQFVVQPAYVEGDRIIRKQVVFTVSPAAPTMRRSPSS